jgi:hypothetical protein
MSAEPEMADLYRQWVAEKLDPLHDEIRALRRENKLMRDMFVNLACAHSEYDLIRGLDAGIEALRRKPQP